ncbi:MAG TPA: S41 family peptidase [Flavobacterium sp.]|nr:S41 family peptidase [Flavobacterium sp.]
MRKSFIYLAVALPILFLGCNADDTNSVPSEVAVQDFVWKGLNLYYLWQDDVQNLRDDRFDSQGSLNAFLKGYPNPTELFNSLLYEKGTIDRFSVIYDDYTVLEQVLTGNTKNNGADYALYRIAPGADQIIGLVRYILPNSDASTKDISRGDLFYAVNGTPLTINNYQSLLATDSYTLNFADYDHGNFSPNGQSVSLTKYDYSENPVYYSNVYSINQHNIGYLVYNGFYGDYDNQLNAAFASFNSQGVTDLVLDLRYNSGGLISTATRLASMITGQFTGQVFAKQQWNAKLMQYFQRSGTEEQLINRFTDKLANGAGINHLNLNRVYVLTTSSTASASELVINGLQPHIEVIQIGTKTIGKNVGSRTLYDSADYDKKAANPKHKYAMQPLVLKIVNSIGFGDYQTGLEPDIEVHEDFENMQALGNINELFLATAISQITGMPSRPSRFMSEGLPEFSDLKRMTPMRTEMYIALEEE